MKIEEPVVAFFQVVQITKHCDADTIAIVQVKRSVALEENRLDVTQLAERCYCHLQTSKADTICCILTDASVWHIFVMRLYESKKYLLLDKYYSFTYTDKQGVFQLIQLIKNNQW